ncbi:MAG TPA: class II aldolase/adducin family protein [Burkholderiales bacterium]|nr:class II aldolase/adducin family protein [Burkholderiales bacterium]
MSDFESAPRGGAVLRHTSSEGAMNEELLDDLVAANRILAEYGVIDAYGHVSIRSPDEPKRFLLARAIAPETVQREDILEYDLDAQALDARGRDSVNERFIHSEIYRARPDVIAVVHNHSPSVVPFSVTGVKMRALFHMASFIGDGLPNFEIRKAKKGSDLLVRTPQLGAALAKSLGKKPAALMRGHGSVVTGENLQRAVGRSIYLEISARMQMQALLLSKQITFLDAAEVKASAPVQDYKRAWPLWRDKALARARADRR